MATKKNEAYIEFKAKTDDFQKGIKAMNSELKNASNELRLNSTQLKGAGDSVDLLSDRQKLLQKELEASTQKVNLTEKSLAECKATLGENSKEYASLNNAVTAAKNQQQAIQNELDATAKKLTAVEENNKQAASAFGQLSDKIDEQESTLSGLKRQYSEVALSQGKNSDEAKSLANEIEKLSTELSDNKRQMSDAESAADKFDKTLDDLGDSAENSGDGFTVAKGAIAGFVANGLTAVVDAAKNAATSIYNLAEETREFRQDMGTLETAFAEANFSAETATDTWRTLYGIFGEDDRAVEAANNIARMAKSQEDLDAWTRITTGVWGTYQDALPVEGLAEAAGETAKVGKVTGGLADALNWSSEASKMFSKYMSEDVVTAEDAFNVALSKCTTEQERQTLITNTLTTLYGDAADKYNETNKSVTEANKATADYTLTQADLGEKIEPVTTAVKEGFNGILNTVVDLAGDGSFEGFADKVTDGFQKISDAMTWISNNKGILTGLGVAIGVIATALGILSAAQAVQAAMNAAEVTSLGALIAAKWASAAAGMAALAPYLLIAAAIAAVIVIIVLCVKHWDKIKEAGAAAWQKIKEVWEVASTWFKEKIIDPIVNFFKGLWESISGFFTSLWQKVVEIFETIKNVISVAFQFIVNLFTFFIQLITLPWRMLWEGIKLVAEAIWNAIGDKVMAALDGIKNVITTVMTAIKDFFTNVWNGIKLIFTTVFNVIKTIVTTYWNAVFKIFSTVLNAIKSVVSTVFNAVKNVIMTIFNAVKDFVTKIWNGIKNAISTPINAAKEAVSNVFNAIRDGISNKITAIRDKVTSIFNTIKDKITTPINAARDAVKTAIDKIKGFFDNLKLKFPSIKLPHFKVTGKFSLDPPSVPKLGIEWYAKGGVFNKPTVIPTAHGLNGFGEAGTEYALPLNERSLTPLATMLNKLTGNNSTVDVLASRFDNAVDRLAARLEALESNIYIDGAKVASATASYNDIESGTRTILTERGLAL